MTKFAFADASISLGVQHVMATAAVEVDRSVHHHLIIDMSYSMCRNLPQLASDCKDILRNSVRVGDKVSIEYFSGRNQFGYIVKSFQVDNAAHIRELDMQIERGFRPIGCTGFVEPIDEAVKHVTADDVNTLMFMSDGYDNCWNAKQILASTAKAGEVFDSIVIVEYGWNANRTLLTQMAREVGAQYVFSENVTEFSRAIDNFIQSKPVAMRRVEVTTGSTIGDIAYADGIVYDVKDGKVQVPENAGDVVYLVNGKSSDTGLNQSHIGSLYGLMSAYATLMRSDVVYDILGELGDVRFIKAFVNCFGKQSYTEFKAMCDKAASDASQRFTEGQDFNLMPDENAFTVLDVINALTEDGVKLLVGSDNFSYNRIGKATASAHSVDHAQLAELSGKLAKAKTSAELKSIQEAISALTEGSKELEFVPTTTEVSFANMTFNSKRPNISGLVRIEGYVNVGSNDLGLPEQVPTFVWRNYTIIRDGIVNMDTVPVKMPYAVYKELRDNGVAMTPWSEDGEVVVTLKGMPIVNRKMVKNVSAKELFRKEVALVELKAFAKVFKEMQDRIAPVNKSAGMAEIYGQVASDWLAERGITDKGFAPKVVQVEGEDFYIGKEIKVSLKGLSSLPKVADVEALIINNANPANRQKKVNVAARMMIKALDAFNKVAVADRAKWIKAQTEKTIDSKRELELDIAKEKFAVIVGQVWFPEFKSMDDNTLTVDYDGESITCSVELKEVEVKI